VVIHVDAVLADRSIAGGLRVFVASVYDELVELGGEKFTKEDLEEALRAIASTISKCEKAQPKLRHGSSQHTLLVRAPYRLRVDQERARPVKHRAQGWVKPRVAGAPRRFG
jgi:hypothetical protein